MKLVQVTNMWCLGGTTMCALAVCKALPDWDHEIIARTNRGAPPDGPPGGQVTFATGTPSIPADTDAVLLHDIAADVMPRPRQRTVMLHHSPAQNRVPADVDLYVSDWLRSGRPGVTIYQSVDSISDRSYNGRFVVGFMATPTNREKWARISSLLARMPGEHEVVGGTVLGARMLAPHQHAAQMYLPLWSVLLYHSPVIESFGRVVVEAMAAGCVPLVDARGGPMETVIDGVTGYLCDKPAEFITRAGELYADRALWRRMSDAAMRHARDRFSHEQFGAELRRLLHVCPTCLER